jgi:hypothetical protein
MVKFTPCRFDWGLTAALVGMEGSYRYLKAVL